MIVKMKNVGKNHSEIHNEQGKATTNKKITTAFNNRFAEIGSNLAN